MNAQKTADSGVVVGWFVWVVSHIEQINGVLQFILLAVSIGATLAAWRYHSKRTPK